MHPVSTARFPLIDAFVDEFLGEIVHLATNLGTFRQCTLAIIYLIISSFLIVTRGISAGNNRIASSEQNPPAPSISHSFRVPLTLLLLYVNYERRDEEDCTTFRLSFTHNINPIFSQAQA